jgi:hypothetical protein
MAQARSKIEQPLCQSRYTLVHALAAEATQSTCVLQLCKRQLSGLHPTCQQNQTGLGPCAATLRLASVHTVCRTVFMRTPSCSLHVHLDCWLWTSAGANGTHPVPRSASRALSSTTACSMVPASGRHTSCGDLSRQDASRATARCGAATDTAPCSRLTAREFESAGLRVCVLAHKL